MSIETLRGIAIILMVAGHVVGAQPSEAMQVPDDSPWRLVFWGLQDFRMPLFTVLSGFVYANRPVHDWPGYRSLTKAKVRRVLIPLVVVGTLVFWAKMLNPDSRSGVGLGDWWKPYVLGMDHLWFLQAIFLLFLIVGALDVLGLVDTRQRWLATTAVSALLYVSALVPNLDFLGIGPAVRLLPFFLLGYGLKRFALRLAPAWVAVLALALAAAFTPRLMALNEIITIGDVRADRALAVVIGVTSILVLFHFRHALTNKYLSWIGGYAFGIYLFHYFALPVVWFGSRAVGLDNDVVKFVLGMILGLGCPILLQVLTRNIGWASLLLFGEKSAPRTPGPTDRQHRQIRTLGSSSDRRPR
ncbi:acyltransferase family protein [Arthrobacter sp. NPDC057388]|uniref:acyltransferase family protein n=1 Tax=Arthrobacter sp. NPDC057388 TaxID=3346116 RepID=UPI00362FC16A